MSRDLSNQSWIGLASLPSRNNHIYLQFCLGYKVAKTFNFKPGCVSSATVFSGYKVTWTTLKLKLS